MRGRWMGLGLLGAVLAAGTAGAAPVAGTCAVDFVGSFSLSPVRLPLGNPNTEGVVASISIDPDAGIFTLDGGSMMFDSYPLGVGGNAANDTFHFVPKQFTGLIDAGGNVDLHETAYQFCTLSPGPGPDCVPGNLCTNDLSDPCVPGAPGTCPGDALCEGVCADDQTFSCADDGDCPGSFCGRGNAVPFMSELTTGLAARGDSMSRGIPLDFGSGVFRLGSVGATPEEAPVIGSTGISAFHFGCTLTTPLDPSTLPPSRWQWGRGGVKHGKGEPGAADDTLTMAATIDPIGAVDLGSMDLEVFLAIADPEPDDTLGRLALPVVTFRIPAGALAGKGKKLKLKDQQGVIDVVPQPPGGRDPRNVVVLKQGGLGAYKMKLVSRGLNLDSLAEGMPLFTGMRVGGESGSATHTLAPRGRVLGF